jgi:hypothetical protein
MTSGWQGKIRQFLARPEQEEWIGVLRIGLALQVVLYCFSLREEWQYLFGTGGESLLHRQLSETLASSQSPLIPRLGWLLRLTTGVGMSETTGLWAIWGSLLLCGICLGVGLFCRGAAIGAWFLHLSTAKSGGFLSYGVDNLMTTGLFYLMWVPLPDRYSFDYRFWRSRSADPDLSRTFRVLLQLHLCVVYFFGGLTKALGSGWWDGTNIWQALTREPFNVIPAHQIAAAASLLPIVGISVWALELSYPFLIWWRRTRPIYLISICLMHAGIGLTMGMYLFALVMIVLNVAAFGPRLARSPSEFVRSSGKPAT